MTALGSNFYFPPSRLNYLVQLRSLLTQKKIVAIEGGIGIGKTVLLEEVLTTSMPEANKCYVTAAKNITDVQLRSRVIEQLFGNVLFDPEKPLVTSFLEFNQQTELMIAVDNAHFLSAKIIGELLQVFSQLNGAGIEMAIVMSFDRSISSTLLNIKSQIITVESVPKLSKDESYQLLSTYFQELPIASDAKVKRWIDNAKGVPIQLLAYDENNNFEVNNFGINLKAWGTVVVLASVILTLMVYAYNVGWLSESESSDAGLDDGDLVEQVVNANKTVMTPTSEPKLSLTTVPVAEKVATAADIFLVLGDASKNQSGVVTEEEKTVAESVNSDLRSDTAQKASVENGKGLETSVLEERNDLQSAAAPTKLTDETQTNNEEAKFIDVSEQQQQDSIVATATETYPEVSQPSMYQIDNDLLLSLPSEQYVLQFTAVSTKATLAEYLASVRVDVADLRIYQIKRNGTDWIVVTYGLYESIKAAREDAQALEPNAWAKSIAVIQQQIRAYQQSFEKSE